MKKKKEKTTKGIWAQLQSKDRPEYKNITLEQIKKAFDDIYNTPRKDGSRPMFRFGVEKQGDIYIIRTDKGTLMTKEGGMKLFEEAMKEAAKHYI